MPDIKCLIVEDEQLASRIIEDYIEQTPGLSLVATCEDVASAQTMLENEQVSMLFLDINLPKINGLEFVQMLEKKYPVILTTAHHEYAVDGFELEVVDYLLKPITYARFLKAVNKLKDFISLSDKANQLEYFFVKSNNKLEKINFSEVLVIEGSRNYVRIHLQGKEIVTYATLKSIEQNLPNHSFIKIQKSFIVAIDKVEQIVHNKVVIGGTSIPISRSNRNEIINEILKSRTIHQ